MELIRNLGLIINKVGVKEIARRSGLSPSTVSRVSSGLIVPSVLVFNKIIEAAGFKVEVVPASERIKSPKLNTSKDILIRLRKELKTFGVRHAFIFGSVARKEDKENSDIDIYLEFVEKPRASILLKAEGLIIDSFSENTVDIVSWLDSEKGQLLKTQIDKDKIIAF